MIEYCEQSESEDEIEDVVDGSEPSPVKKRKAPSRARVAIEYDDEDEEEEAEPVAAMAF